MFFRRPSNFKTQIKMTNFPVSKIPPIPPCFHTPYGIAVRIASEAVDDDFVFDFKIQCVSVGIVFKQRNGLFVDNLAFAVHQRHEHEMAFVRQEVGETGLTDGFLGKDECGQILGKCLGAVAKKVARELVEQDDFGEPALQGVAPVCEPAANRLLPDIKKSSANLGIESIVLGKQ